MDAGERKKRKVEFEGVKKEEEKDDEEVEEFFAIIRSTKEIRERMNMMNAGSALGRVNIEQENKGVGAAVAVEATPWNPTFRPEDFMGDHGPSSTTNINESLRTSDKKEEDKKKKDEDVGLDLNLSL